MLKIEGVAALGLEYFTIIQRHSSLGHLTLGAFAEKCRSGPSASEQATGLTLRYLGSVYLVPLHIPSGMGETNQRRGWLLKLAAKYLVRSVA